MDAEDELAVTQRFLPALVSVGRQTPFRSFAPGRRSRAHEALIRPVA
jgi:hypothetical protein